MKPVKFVGTILSGHKEDAVEVPFDPAMRWGKPERRLWPGRRGHFVRGKLNGIPFESAVVTRSRKFYVLLRDDIKAAAGVKLGDRVQMSLEPAVGERIEN